MKIIHTSDWHLGRIIYGHSLIEDQRFFIENFFFPLIESEKPDAIIIAGDLFDRQIAPVEAIRLFDMFITKMCTQYHIPVIATAGNHDGADRLGLGTNLLSSSGVHITTRLGSECEPVILQNGKKQVHIYSLPYFDPAIARDYTGNEALKNFNDAYSEILEKINSRLCSDAFNILTAHCFVTGSTTSDSESTLFVGGSGEVDVSVFECFDYVALGHLHRAQGNGNARYSGSPLKYSFDEEGHDNSVTILEIDDEIEISKRAVAPLRNMRTVTGTLDEIKAAAATDTNTDDYIFALLDGPPVFEPMSKLRTVYPNTLAMTHSEFKTNDDNDDRDELRVQLKKRNSIMIFDEFIKQMCDSDVSDEDREVFLNALNEITKGDSI